MMRNNKVLQVKKYKFMDYALTGLEEVQPLEEQVVLLQESPRSENIIYRFY